jgi:hypothetical protein
MVREEEVMVARGAQRVLMSVVGGGSPLCGSVFQLLRCDAGTRFNAPRQPCSTALSSVPRAFFPFFSTISHFPRNRQIIVTRLKRTLEGVMVMSKIVKLLRRKVGYVVAQTSLDQ